MRTIAEGVEHPIEATMLRQRGCAAFQGFLVSRPLPADEVLPFLAHWRAPAVDEDEDDDTDVARTHQLTLPAVA
jgi:sensor c-di-GMP phosphodiesterase-like protein